MAVAEQIEALVSEYVDLTDHQLSERIFGAPSYYQFVSMTCDQLVKEGRLFRTPAQSGRHCTYSSA